MIGWRILCCGLCCLQCLACSVVTVKPDDLARVDRPPDYEESVPYYFFGLIGSRHFDIKDICFGRQADQIRTEHTLSDMGRGVKTLFFFFPKTAKIWCKPD